MRIPVKIVSLKLDKSKPFHHVEVVVKTDFDWTELPIGLLNVENKVRGARKRIATVYLEINFRE